HRYRRRRCAVRRGRGGQGQCRHRRRPLVRLCPKGISRLGGGGGKCLGGGGGWWFGAGGEGGGRLGGDFGGLLYRIAGALSDCCATVCTWILLVSQAGDSQSLAGVSARLDVLFVTGRA